MLRIALEDVGRPLTSDREAALAREAARAIAARLDDETVLRLRLLDDDRDAETVTLPPSAVRLLVSLLEELGRGKAVELMPVHAELTTQQAADLVHVSRPFLIRLLDEGRIPFRRVGTHRRVRLDDVMAYKHASDRKRREALDALAALDQEMGLE